MYIRDNTSNINVYNMNNMNFNSININNINNTFNIDNNIKHTNVNMI